MELNFYHSRVGLVIALITISVASSSAQRRYTMSGIVKDAKTGETLLGASIFIESINRGQVSNEYGFYSMTLPKGTYQVAVSYMGYEKITRKLNINRNIKKDFLLNSESNLLDEIILEKTTTKKKNSQVKGVLVGVNHLKKTDITRLPAFMGEPDINRTLLTQAGISSNGESTSGFNVRGGNIDQNLILLDEAPLYNSSHLWGFFSAFNSNAIKDLKLYKGGIPARFGGRASSVLDIRQNEGNEKYFTGEGGIGLLFSKLTLEGPIAKDKVSFLLAGRRSYFDLFFPLSSDESLKRSKVYFYDLSSKIKWKINAKNTLLFSGYFGADVMKFNIKNDSDTETSQSVNFSWHNSTASLRWNRIFSDQMFMNLSTIYSAYDYGLESKNTIVGGPTNKSGTFTWESRIQNWIIKPNFTLYLDNGAKVRFGADNTLYLFSPAKVTGDPNEVKNVDFKTEKGLELAPYASFEQTWNKFTLNTGLRWSWFGNLGAYEVANYPKGKPRTIGNKLAPTSYGNWELIKSYNGLEPRLNFKYLLGGNKSIKLAYNRMFQYVHLISNTASALPFDIWKPSGKYIKPLQVDQVTLGYAYDTPSGAYSFSLEGYYKTFKNIVDYKDGANLFLNKDIETELLNADGYSYGVEFTTHKNIGRLTGNLNYTYSVTRRKNVDAHPSEIINEGAYYPSNFDRPHIFNLTLDYKTSKRWRMGLFFTYQTGRPNTDPTSRYQIGDRHYLVYDRRNNGRLGANHRMDLSFTCDLTRAGRKVNYVWSFGAYNLYSRKNPFSRYYTGEFITKELKVYRFAVLGTIVPFVTLNFKF